MKYSTTLISVLAGVSTVSGAALKSRGVPTNLIPPLGIKAGTSPDGHGNCKGANGILIPCSCPPSMAVLLPQLNANVAAGHAVKNPVAPVHFPTDNSAASQIARIQAVVVTLQNLNGPGVGCPASSTTLLAQQAAVHKREFEMIERGEYEEFEKRTTPQDVANLAPNLGFSAGVNPTGTGDCDGAVNGPTGAPIKIPCACPPSQGDFITALQANVAAGHAVNNPPIAVPFPTDASPNSQRARIEAGLVTLQNLHGPGQGCPAVSSTLSAQLSAVQG